MLQIIKPVKLTENTLGARIKAQRIRCGMTQEELAEAMCIPKSTISAYENDKQSGAAKNEANNAAQAAKECSSADECNASVAEETQEAN